MSVCRCTRANTDVYVCVCVCVCVLPFHLQGAAPELALSIFSLHGSSLTNNPVWIQASASLYLQIHLHSFDPLSPIPPHTHTHTHTHVSHSISLYTLKIHLSIHSVFTSPFFSKLNDDVYFEGWHCFFSTQPAKICVCEKITKKGDEKNRSSQLKDQREENGSWTWSSGSALYLCKDYARVIGISPSYIVNYITI